MAANALVACDPFTTWYAFSHSLSWSNNCEVADILSDIPSISVGILVFAVSLLFFVLRRVSLFWLFASTSLAFVAAVVDLGKLLADEVARDSTLAASLPTIRAREILLALSLCFRLLFYWSYVAEPPRKCLSTVSTPFSFRIKLESTYEPHGASWTRWGWPGKLLGVGLLAAIVVITTLQITWRVVHRFHQYSSIYAADAVLQLLVSFLFLLKLLLNTVAPDSPNNMLAQHTFNECLAPISALLVNIAIGVGGLLLFAFTESTVGRLLQAFEVCIIVVFVVVIAFFKHRDMPPATSSSQGAGSRDSPFTLPEPVRGSTFRITTPYVETPRLSTVLGTATPNRDSSRVLHRSARRSLNHVSSWVSSKFSRNRSRRGDEEVKLWNAENVKANPPYSGSIVTEPRTGSIVSSQESRGWGEHVCEAPNNYLSVVSALDGQVEIARSMKGSIHSGRILHAGPPDVPRRMISPQVQTGSTPLSSVPPSVSPGTTHASMAMALQDRPSNAQSLASASESRTSLEELLRQQSQLDQSIEALRLFSPRTSVDSNTVLSPQSVELSRSASIGQRTISSDVSLSNFPVPPWSTNSVPSLPSSPGLSAIKRLRDRRVRLAAVRTTPVQDTYTPFPPKSAASIADIPSSPRLYSIPHTPVGEENEHLYAVAGEPPRPDSGGTQYNVTSFIGGRRFSGSGENVSDVSEGLATPGESKLLKPWLFRERESGLSVGTSETSSSIYLIPPRTLPLERQLALSSMSSQGDVVDEPAVSMVYGINEQRTHSPAISVSPPTPATHPGDAGDNTSTTGPPRESGSPISPLAGGAVSNSQRTFVRPRPPPLIIKSHAGQNPGSSRVQVLAED